MPSWNVMFSALRAIRQRILHSMNMKNGRPIPVTDPLVADPSLPKLEAVLGDDARMQELLRAGDCLWVDEEDVKEHLSRGYQLAKDAESGNALVRLDEVTSEPRVRGMKILMTPPPIEMAPAR